jgi:hypothetical protein
MEKSMEMSKKRLFVRAILSVLVALGWQAATAQVSMVEFGRNKVQHKTFKWKYYQTKNFNIYFTYKTKFLVSGNNSGVTDENRADDGETLAKYVAQVAEKELPEIENTTEYGLQRRGNIILYNNYNDYTQSNIGQGIDWQIPGGITKLVNNKAAIYYNSDHNNLRIQVRQSIVRMLVDNVLFGEDLGEIAGNQALLDLPKWLTEGYITYVAENWNTDLDDQLKSALLSGSYKNFYEFAFYKPALAGHSFWRFLADNYKKENVTYFLYLTRVYKSLNSASERICKKKFKALLQEYMEKETDKYYEDLTKRKNNPRGRLFTMEDVSGKKDFFKFQANPAPRSQDYAVVEYKKGVYRIYLYENWVDKKLLLKFGAKTNYKEYNSQYPLLAWDPKGTRLAVLYSKEGKIRLFVYDAFRRIKIDKTEFPSFDQVQDMQYMVRSNSLLFSAVKNGQSDIWVYNIDNTKLERVTNDVYDDIDPTYVTFPNKTGILFSSNRPTADAPSNDTMLLTKGHNRYHIYLVDDWNKSEFKRLSKLSNHSFGDARYPSQYNQNHFTFVSDEKGVANRYAGFFKAESAGLDTLVYIGDEVLHNPTAGEADSLLKAFKKTQPDSIGYFRITNDSAYTFPITNYESNIVESRVAGDNDQISETRREGDFKLLYKLKIDEDKLRRRNVNIRPSEYMRKVMLQDKMEKGEAEIYKQQQDSIKKSEDIFQTEFGNDKDTTSAIGKIFDAMETPEKEDVLKKSKLFPYKLKFSADYFVSGFNNSVLVNRFQPYAGGQGPVQLSGGTPLDGMLRVGTSDLMEDLKFSGGYRLATDFQDNDWLFQFHYLKKRVDMGFTYYRTSQRDYPQPGTSRFAVAPNKLYSNLYQANFSYPFDEVRSLRGILGYRNDRLVLKSYSIPDLLTPDSNMKFVQTRIEYVHDNTLNPAQNIWNGLRYKIYAEGFANATKNVDGKFTYNVGVDARHYQPIYRHIIWAVRGAADFSWGTQKMLYYVGGVDNWLIFGGQANADKYFITGNRPANDQTYAYQTLGVNLRGFKQNAANGNNNMVINSEIRVPVFTTFINRPINNAFLRNFQLVQFFDLGTAWNGKYNKLKRPTTNYSTPGNPATVQIQGAGIGPFLGGYGFGVRSVLLGYFIRFDAAWQMNVFFKHKPQLYVSLGLDF